jgi:ABC-type polysaccharide/polyol phosphate transport system ATPase subunit
VRRRGPFDPDRGEFIFISGRKGSGKSVLARRLFDAYPYDKLVIDPTGDVRAGMAQEGVRFVDLTEPMPVRGRRRTSRRPR